MAGSLLIALLALAMDFILGFIEKRIRRHSAKAKRTNKMMAAVAAVLCLGIVGGAIIHIPQKDTIHIATKPMTEQYILGEMLDILIEQDTDLNVELTQGVGGGTSNIQPAMESGEFDLYPEYTGTGWNAVLKHDGLYTEDLFGELKNEYSERFHMDWIGMYGFDNTYGLVVRREIAEKYNLKTYFSQVVISREKCTKNVTRKIKLVQNCKVQKLQSTGNSLCVFPDWLHYSKCHSFDKMKP